MARYDVGASVVLFGGETYDPGEPFAFADTWIWNGLTTNWTPQAATGPRPRAEASIAYDAARRVVVLFGGYGPYWVIDDPSCVKWGCVGEWAMFNDTWILGAV
jgi:hypothetical protein